MKKIFHTFIYGVSVFLLIAAAAMFIDLSQLNHRLTNFFINFGIIQFDEDVNSDQRSLIYSIYNPSFQFPRSRVETAMTYIPIYEINDIYVAKRFSLAFNMPFESITETETAFIFKSCYRTLTIYKYINYVTYFSENIKSENEINFISHYEAKIIGAFFMQERNLPFTFSEVVVNEESGTFVITYVSYLSGLLNYAFPIIIKIDETGFVYSLEHYFFEFERLAQCGLKTMRQAFYELPTDFPPHTRIDLKRATLVYIFENSILQPAYLFEGEFECGETFRAFVNAARFGV